jgi:hypothetical protein
MYNVMKAKAYVHANTHGEGYQPQTSEIFKNRMTLIIR